MARSNSIRLMSGNEAVARGAYEAGVSFAAAYPGTPSTEILETIAAFKDDVIAEWAPNEKVALESAIGASIAGARALAAMKMVGVNVAADPLFSCAYSGVNGGLVLVSADDPSMHSSQNEQDNRHFAPFAKIPMLEPSDSQESHDMMRAAFVVSETFDVPVLFRMTTRVCHSRSLVQIGERTEVPLRPYAKNAKFDLLPAVSYRLRAELEGKLAKLAAFSEVCPLNRVEWHATAIGIVTSGIAYQYAREVFGDSASYLKLGFTYPLPREKIAAFAASVGRLYVIEELDPYLENEIRALGIACTGKDRIPGMYELNPEIIAEALLGKRRPSIATDDAVMVPRPPMMCAGCPHRGFFVQLGRATRRINAKRQKFLLAGDIGCYALGGSDPLNAVETTICMGAAPSIGHGAQKIFDKFGANTRVIAMQGDSTFFHTGINSLMDIAYNKSNTITCILDNRATGMTGQQDNPHTGFTLQGEPTREIAIEDVVRAIGIEHVRVVNPMDLADVDAALQDAFRLDQPSVIITRWPCALKRKTRYEMEEFKPYAARCAVEEDRCNGCGLCLSVGCPAISCDKASGKARIDPVTCTGCAVCLQVCNFSAIAGEA